MHLKLYNRLKNKLKNENILKRRKKKIEDFANTIEDK